ncbi:putative metalloprotease CJM1_0395 family protein [Marinobacter sp.]|uniref:putative metalloprotease CJM1_0395 family protein n=1 Tax=Marinobacter sp. TaxID=50741 RepID=UPI0035669C3B
MNVLSSISPVYPSVTGAAAPGSGSTAIYNNSSVSGEKPLGGDDRLVRKTEQVSEGKSSNVSTGRESHGERAGAQGLTDAELQQLTELKARDREVRAHEAAHQAVGGQHAGAMSFTYERGPDGAQYAVGGEVSIDVSVVAGDPQATIEKMRVVRSAAMAPAQPSSQDRAVAAQAMQIMLQAQSELATSESENGSVASRVTEQHEGPGEPRLRQAADTYQSISSIHGYGTNSDAATSVFA